MEKCVQVLIINYQDQILAEAPGLIKSGQIDRLQILYRLINRTLDGIPTLLDDLRSHICEEGLAAMKAHAAEICTDSERFGNLNRDGAGMSRGTQSTNFFRHETRPDSFFQTRDIPGVGFRLKIDFFL